MSDQEVIKAIKEREYGVTVCSEASDDPQAESVLREQMLVVPRLRS